MKRETNFPSNLIIQKGVLPPTDIAHTVINPVAYLAKRPPQIRISLNAMFLAVWTILCSQLQQLGETTGTHQSSDRRRRQFHKRCAAPLRGFAKLSTARLAELPEILSRAPGF